MKKTKYPMSYWATPADKGLVKVLSVEHLPSGESCLTVPCADYKAFKKLPKLVEYCGTKLGRTGWNSDLFVAYYKTGWAVECYAKSVKG